MKKIIQALLKAIAKIILKKYQPRVIGITGSVGKTSAKEAVYAVISAKFRARRGEKNYNNEIGLPLTIIGASSAGRSVMRWLAVFLRASKIIFFKDKNYPEILILEMGIDHPGDMEYLLSIAQPEIGILTFIGSVHAEFFGTQEKLRQEKSLLIKNLDKSGYSIINYDNEGARKSIGESKAKVISYGMDEKANLRAQEIKYLFAESAENPQGVNFKIMHNGAATPVLLPNVMGVNAIYAALSAAAVGIVLGMNMVEISQALKNMVSPKGRMNLLKGIKNTLIIDDTYNSEPQSAMAALRALKMIPAKNKRIAVLGDMLELGRYSEEAHSDLGGYLFKLGINELVIIGERSLDIKQGALKSGMPEDAIFHFARSADAGIFIQERIKAGDVILVKGSQGMRMEKIVKEIMSEPQKAEELLVRQDKEWQNK